MTKKLDHVLYCSFCGKNQTEVEKLVAGPNVFICCECIEISFQIVFIEGNCTPTFDFEDEDYRELVRNCVKKPKEDKMAGEEVDESELDYRELTAEEIKWKDEINFDKESSKKTLLIALQHHTNTMTALNKADVKFWDQMRSKLGVDEDTGIMIKKWQGRLVTIKSEDEHKYD